MANPARLVGLPVPPFDTAPVAAAPVVDDPSRPLEERVIAVLRSIRDPEIPISIYDLGLIYGLTIRDGGDVHIRMTLTTPACPTARSLPGFVETKVRALAGVREVEVEIVWDPPWTKERMSDAARLQLGLL